MARKATTPAEQPVEDQVKPGTALVNWEKEMARQAKVAADMEANAGGGQFFSLKSGVLSFNDAAMPGNQMAVIILDSILERVFYEGDYDPDRRVPPTCFAMGREEANLVPHPTVFEAEQQQNPTCKGCEWDAWGSADKGKGKACRQTRRLAVIPVGAFDNQGRFTAVSDPDVLATASVGFLKPPVTSVKNYATMVKQVAGALGRPPYGVYTRVRVVPDAKNQFTVLFEVLGEVPRELLPVVMKRNQEVQPLIDFPYDLTQQEEAPKKLPAKGKAPARRGAKY